MSQTNSQNNTKNTMQKTSPLILVDGSSYLYRAFHAMPNFQTSKGMHTGAIYGVVNMLRKLLQDYQPHQMVVVFDAKGKTFRNDLYADYKANRPPMPDELRTQIEPLHQLIDALGIPRIVIEGVEADDVIGTLATQAGENQRDTLISTSDKDMAQLVNEHVRLIDTMKDVVMDRDGVIEKFGIPPEKIIDYLSLMGDKSDNIPGVPKVGPKTAVKWLNEYGSLDAIMAQADKVKGKVGENLRDSLQQLPLSRTLATIKCDIELGMSDSDLELRPRNEAQLKSLYAELEFKSWLSEIISAQGTETTEINADSEPVATNYQCILDQDSLNQWLKRLQSAQLFAFDTETTSLDAMKAEVVGLSFAITPHEAAYVPLTHDYAGAPEQLQRDKVLKQLEPLLNTSPGKVVGQHIKYDINVLAGHGIKLQGVAHDTMLQSYVLDSTATRHDMDSLSLKYLSHKTISFEDVAGKGKQQLSFNEVGIEDATNYAAEDADITLQLHQKLWQKLQNDSDLKKLYQDIELPLIHVLAAIERNGVLLDKDMLAQQSRELEDKCQELEQKAHEIAGEAFNLSSPKQIQQILYDKQKLPVLKKTPKKQPSTSEEVLQELALDYPLPKLILEYRSLAKLQSTYTDKLPDQINTKTGRVHTSYHQATASTGRLASKDPNLQNIPIRTPEGRRIRQAFIAPPGHKILAADYSQIELRIMAHLSSDQTLLDAFAHDVDVHRVTAAEVFGIDQEQVGPEERRRAKAINFGLIYGMSAFGLGKQLGIERGEAQRYIDLYFERYPGVKNFMDQTRELARDRGYVQTVFGRRLYLPDIKHSNYQRRQYAERTAINAPMQGTAADIIKLAMINTQNWINQSELDVKMIMQVHDELVFEVNDKHLQSATAEIKQLMESVAGLTVPLKVDAGSGENWEQAH